MLNYFVNVVNRSDDCLNQGREILKQVIDNWGMPVCFVLSSPLVESSRSLSATESIMCHTRVKLQVQRYNVGKHTRRRHCL